MPEPIGVQIRGTGFALPEKAVPNAYFETIVDTSDEWIRERTGIQQRYIANDSETTGTLSLSAARMALEEAGLKPSDLDMILVATVTPEQVMPSTACWLQHELGCPFVGALDISAACSGFVYGVVIAISQIHALGYRNVLVVGAETLSRITNFQDRTSCVLFGDGAGAAVISRTDNTDGPVMICCNLHADGGNGDLLTLPAGGSRLPTSQMTLDERLHYMRMRGPELFKVAVPRMAQNIRDTVESAGLTLDDIALIIPHQSNVRIMESVARKLDISMDEKMYVNIDRLGNTSSASIPIALAEVRRSGRLKSGDLVLLMAFGAGLTWGSILFRV